MKRILSLILFFSVIFSAQAQRFSSGINLNLPALSFVRYEQNYYNPINLNRIYFINPPEKEKDKYFKIAPFNFKWHTKVGIGLGYILKIDYKRFAVRTGVQMSFTHAKLKFSEFEYNAEPARYKTEFGMSSVHLTFPLLVSIDIQRKNNARFILIGAETGYFTLMSESIDEIRYDRDFLSYMYGIYYNEHAWVNLNLGIGKKWKAFEWYTVYKHRIDQGQKDLTIKSSTLEVNGNFYFGYSTVRKNHYLYREN